MQTDPVGYDDGINWYAYCGNNPLIWVDPSGLMPTLPDFCDVDLYEFWDDFWSDLEDDLDDLEEDWEDFIDEFEGDDVDFDDLVDDFLDIIDDATDTLEDVYIGGPKRFPQQFPLPDPFWPPTIPDIPYDPTQTPERQKQIDDLTREGMGEDATGRDASGNSSFIFPKSGGGGCTFIIVPLEIIGPFLQSIGIDIITPRPRPPGFPG